LRLHLNLVFFHEFHPNIWVFEEKETLQNFQEFVKIMFNRYLKKNQAQKDFLFLMSVSSAKFGRHCVLFINTNWKLFGWLVLKD
jgi:hypothetical protein